MVHNSDTDTSISLKFSTLCIEVAADVLQTFKVKEPQAKVTVWYNDG